MGLYANPVHSFFIRRMVALHCGITRDTVRQIRSQSRKMNIVSRGGSLVFAWMSMTGEENPFYEYFDQILCSPQHEQSAESRIHRYPLKIVWLRLPLQTGARQFFCACFSLATTRNVIRFISFIEQLFLQINAMFSHALSFQLD